MRGLRTPFEMLGAAAAFLLMLSGVRMVLRPAAYLGTGTPPATDPRTVRIFGYAFAVFGLMAFGGAITHILEG